jgi:hypothetical protein
METTLFVVDSDAELTRARALVDRLMTSDKPADLAQLAAQAHLVTADEGKMAAPGAEPGRGEPPPDGSARVEARRSCAAVGERRAGPRYLARPAPINALDGAAIARPLSGASRPAAATRFVKASPAPPKSVAA